MTYKEALMYMPKIERVDIEQGIWTMTFSTDWINTVLKAVEKAVEDDEQKGN